MSQQSGPAGSKTPTTIKIAAKEASQRNSAGADPGPGDSSAAPSVAPQLVDIPDPPTSSQLVVKSADSRKIATLHEGRSGTSGRGPKSTIMSGMGSSKHQGSKHSTVGGRDHPASGVPHEPTSSRPLSGPGIVSKSTISGAGGGGPSGTPPAPAAGGGSSPPDSPPGPATASMAMQADSGAEVHDEDEEGEGEMEQPDEATTPGGTPVSPSGASQRGSGSAAMAAKSISDTASSASGVSRASVPPGAAASELSKSATGAPSSSSMLPSDKDKKKKKVTKFRYHKRITVRTSGKTSPTQVMDKVNKKDHRAGITPSQIEEMDPQELMKRAGIKANKKTHWRVRLRQTKRLTKGGKTTTQTKIAYRDSEGNKHVKTVSSPFCKSCGKKLEECRCP